MIKVNLIKCIVFDIKYIYFIWEKKLIFVNINV